MTKPSDLPVWDENETNANEPDASRQADGWLAPGGIPEKPPFQYFNWWQNNVFKWIKEINDKGILQYSNDADYAANLSYVVGSDGNLYQCKINNGPSSSIVDPVGDGTGTWTPSSLNIARLGRSIFSRASLTQVLLTGGAYQHYGTKTQILVVNSPITHTITTPGVSQFQYIYADDSAIVTSGKNILTASEIINSTTAPTYDPVKKGWYNGDDLCLFAVYIDSGGDVANFWHDGSDFVEYDDHIVDLNGVDIDTTFVDVTLTIPDFGDNARALVAFWPIWSNNPGPQGVFYRKNGGNANTNYVGYFSTDSRYAFNSTRVTVDSTQKIEVKLGAANDDTLTIRTQGFYLPMGL